MYMYMQMYIRLLHVHAHGVCRQSAREAALAKLLKLITADDEGEDALPPPEEVCMYM